VDWEEEMKKLRMVLLAGLLIVGLCATAQAWEFHMSGNFQWTYEYHAQGGANGFFGPQNQANAALAGLGNWQAANFWVGARLMDGTQYGLVTGLDSSINYQRMVLNPEIRVNPAIRIRGQYWIGGFGPYDNLAATTVSGGNAGTIMTTRGQYASSYYINQQTGSVITAPLALGQWNLLWVTAQTPWGILVFGKRGGPFGMGLLNDEGERTVVSESLAIVAPYGPLRIGIFAYPWRQGVLLDNQRNMGALGAPQLGQVASNTQGTIYPKLWDASNIRLSTPQMGAFVTYSNGPLDAGIIYLQWQQHQGPEAAPTLAAQLSFPTTDANTEGGNAYVKYNNGRFFFNAEVAWNRWDNRFQQPAVPLVDPLTALGLGSIYQPVFTEDWDWGTEFGFLCGPSKLSFLYAYFMGMDRRNGIWISKQSYSSLVWGLVGCNQALFLPYSYLMGYTYASGLNYRNGLGEGGFADASVVASRLDYAVAANLNWYGSFIWAWRNGSWPWGTLTVNGGNLSSNAVQVFGLPAVSGNSPAVQNAGGVRAPNIPDNNLGWELTTGVDWKLLEGLTTNLRLAYWQPGEWFKYACLDKTLVTNTVGGVVNGNLAPQVGDGAAIGSSFGVNPAKSIDGIWAFSGQLNVDF
jgi:hypothetical protein